MQLLGRDNGEAGAEIEAHLMAEDRARPGASTVALGRALVEDFL